MKQDQKLVAVKEDNGREVKYVARKYKVAAGVVLMFMYLIGKNGKAARSRKKIYKEVDENLKNV